MATRTRLGWGFLTAVVLSACSGPVTEPRPANTTIRPPESSLPAASVMEPSSAASPPPVSISASPPGFSVPLTGDAGSLASGGVVPPGAPLAVNAVSTGLDVPWGIGFLPDGSALIAGRDDASIKLLPPTNGESANATVIGTVDGVEPGGEGGLLGLAVSPAFAEDGLVYVYYSAADDNRIATVTLRDGVLADQQVIFEGIPRANIHNGGRLAFGPDGLLYVGTGDAGERPDAQDLGSLGGKILRLAPNGSPAAGNPLTEAPAVYSYGHRNVQGLAFDAQDRLWAAEFGQNTYDELNLIVPGGNYGWPEVEGPTDGNSEYVAPERFWPTDDASPSGIAVWQGSVWMAGLRGERLWQIPVTGGPAGAATGEPVSQLDGVYGRLRTAVAAPDGSLWVSTSNTDGRGDVRDGDDRVLRLEFTA